MRIFFSGWLRTSGSLDVKALSITRNTYTSKKTDMFIGPWVHPSKKRLLSTDRHGIEKLFRDSKSSDHIQVNPFYHWTDSKIRCQLLACAIALTVLRLLEITVNGEGRKRYSGRWILEEMSHLNSTWLWYAGKRMPEQALDTPTKTQADVLKVFGWKIGDGGVLQSIDS